MGSPGSSLYDVVSALRRGAPLVLACVLGATLVGAVATLLVTPRYQSEASIRIGSTSGKSSLFGEVSPLIGLAVPGLQDDEIDTDLGVLRSRSVAETVVDSLRLHVRLDAPAGRRADVLQVLNAPRDARPGRYLLRHTGDGSYVLRVESGLAPAAIPRRIQIGEPFDIGDVTVALAPELRMRAPAQIRVSVRSYRRTVADLRDALIVQRQTGRSRLVELRYRNPDAELAAAVPNVAASAFIELKTRTSKAESRSTVDVLREQIAGYESDLRNAEERLREFREGHQVVSLGSEAAEQIKRLAQLQAQRDQLLVEQRSLGATLQAIRSAAGDNSAAYRRLAAFPSFLAHRGVQEILLSLIQLENQRAELLVRRTVESEDVIGIDERVEQLEEQLYHLGRSYLAGIDDQLGAANGLLAGFADQLQTVPLRELEYARLARDQKLLDEIYTILQTRLREAEIQEAVDLGDVRVIDRALVAERPVSPKPLMNVTLAALLGLFLGFTLVVGRETLNQRIRTGDDVTDAADTLPVLGRVPIPESRTIERTGRWRVGPMRKRFVELPAPVRLVRDARPWSAEAEAFRALQARLRLTNRGGGPQVLVMTCATAEQGASESAANLGFTFARHELKTLLIDADLRAGRLARVLNAAPAVGLAELLAGDVALGDAVQQLARGASGTPLEFLSAGSMLPTSAAPLGSDRMRQLFAELRTLYDVVIVDAPPIDAAPDAVTLGSFADATILFARLGHTEKRALHQAVAQLQSLGIPLGGIILGDAGANHVRHADGAGAAEPVLG